VVEKKRWRVAYRLARHTTRCHAYALEIPTRYKVDSEKLAASPWTPGPWLGQLITHVEDGGPKDAPLNANGIPVTVQEAEDSILVEVPPHRTVYVTDTLYTSETAHSITQLAENADLFYCEAVFLQQDAERAHRTHHLTASQCGQLARAASVRKLKTFHHSRRYPSSDGLLKEVREHFPDAE
jgi:ribonuclease Z